MFGKKDARGFWERRYLHFGAGHRRQSLCSFVVILSFIERILRCWIRHALAQVGIDDKLEEETQRWRDVQ